MKSKEIQDIYQALENFEMRLTRLEDIMIGKQDETISAKSIEDRVATMESLLANICSKIFPIGSNKDTHDWDDYDRWRPK